MGIDFFIYGLWQFYPDMNYAPISTSLNVHFITFSLMFYLRIWIVIFLGLISCNRNDPSSTVPALFTLLDKKQTGIDFNNILTEGLNTNILMYEYFYNGGGVATGDLNGDDWLDLYFTSNMADNKIYLNKGKFQFEDISLLCGAQGRPGPWKTGISLVDINGDGKLDIYLCHSGSLPDEKRKNELFVNQGNNARGVPQFVESAEEYGLASPAFSTQAYFFDYDIDADLDMILLNHNPKNLPMLNEASTAELFKQDDSLRGTRLYRNDLDKNGKFTDVTLNAGINGSPLSYGLGIGISDLNNDGWPDFYLSNDYNVPDYLYINNKNGTFSNKLSDYISHISQFSMGNDIADINNDGDFDIFTLDMLPEDNHRQKLLLAPDNYNKFELNVRSGFYFQYMRNMLQLNNGDGSFSEVGQLAGISNTDWSWSALFQDFDDDGIKDLHITNGYKRDYTNLDFINYMDEYVKNKGRLMREDVMQIIEKMPASNISNYVYSGSENLKFSDQTKTWGFHQPSNSNGAAYADLDNDGDQDIIVNNINQPAFIYRNEINLQSEHNYIDLKLKSEGPNTFCIGAKVQLYTDGATQSLELFTQRGYQSTVSSTLHFGLAKTKKIDSLKITWPSGKIQTLTDIKINQSITLHEPNGGTSIEKAIRENTIFKPVPFSGEFVHQQKEINDFDRQYLLPSALSYSGPCLTIGDLNADGLEDIVFGGSVGQSPGILFQEKRGSFTNIKWLLKTGKDFEGSHPLIFDANNDDLPDILIPGTGYHYFNLSDNPITDILYINEGQGNFSMKNQVLPEMPFAKSKAIAIDVNRDGFQDLFIGSKHVPGSYPLSPSSYVLINNKKGKFELAQELKLGMITDAIKVNMNEDTLPDIVVVGDWMSIKVLLNEDGKLINKSSDFFNLEYSGWWNTVYSADFNNDNIPDFVLGNHGFNSQIKASESEPVEMIIQDFDRNGTIDPVFSTFIQGKSYPFVTRDELLKQLSYLKPKYNSFSVFADATLNTIFKQEDINSSTKLKTTHLQSGILISDNKNFTFKPFPLMAQSSPVYNITVIDYNRDGLQDVVLTGNNHHFKIRIGQMDANHGILLKNGGDGNFEYIPQRNSGLKLQGDVRSVIKLSSDIILFGINGKSIQAYQLVK